MICKNIQKIVTFFFLSISRTIVIKLNHYDDGEDAYAMKRNLVQWAKDHNVDPANADSFFETEAHVNS